jgi:hypothetical protein
MRTKVFKLSVVILASFLLVAGIGLANSVNRGDTQTATASNAHIITTVGNGGSGTASDPFRIGSLADLNNRRNELSSNTQRHFILVGNIESNISFVNIGSTVVAFISNNNIIDGQVLDNGQPAFTITNVNASIFSSMSNSTIRNINFTGNGNIATNFNDSTMQNVHHVSGTVTSATATLGGLVHNSHNSTFINSSNNATINRTAGTVANMGNVNGGLIGRSTGTLTMTRCRNTGAVTAATGNSSEVSAGLVGRIDGTESSLIEYSWNEGHINGIRSAGFVGRKDGAGTLTIRESRNGHPTNNTLGRIENRVGQSAAAGFLAWLHLGTVHIASSVNYGTITSSGTAASGIFSTGIGGFCFINNSLNMGSVLVGISNNAQVASSLGNITCAQNTISTIGIGTRATEAQLRHPNILNTLGVAFAMGLEGLPVLREFSPVVLFFHLNGGSILGDTAPHIVAADVYTSPPVPVMIGYDFVGWDKEISTTESGTYFAVWNIISYRIRTHGTTLVQGQQHWQLLNSTNNDPVSLDLPSDQRSIGANLMLRTGLSGLDPIVDHFFTKWEVQMNEDTDQSRRWYDHGAGITPDVDTNALPGFHQHEQRYYFHINENFIQRFAQWDEALGEWYFAFQAIFGNDRQSAIVLDAGAASQRVMGTMKVDGIEFTRLFRTNIPENAKFTVSAEANEYFEFVRFRTRVGGEPWVEFEKTHGRVTEAAGVYSIELDAVDALEVRIDFMAQPISIRVQAQVAGMGDAGNFNGVAAGVFQNNGAPDWVSLQFGRNAFQGINILSTPSYRLVNRSIRNIKIRNWDNTSEVEYTYFSAINGRINISNMDTDFFNRHINAGEIVIVVLFHRQVMLQVGIIGDDAGLGDFLVTVTDQSRIRHRIEGPDNGFGFFDFRSIVTINAFPFGDATIKQVVIFEEGMPPIAFDNPSQIPSFYLEDRTQITIEFERADFKLSVTGRDIHGRAIDEEEFFGISQIDVQISTLEFSGFTVWDRESGFGLHNYLRLSIDNLTGFEDEWSFLGWFVVLCGQGGNLDLISTSNMITLDNTYYFPKYLGSDDTACCGNAHTDMLEIVARFARITTVVFRVSENGTHETSVINEEDGGDHRGGDVYTTGTIIELLFKPNPFFTYEIANLEQNETVTQRTISGATWFAVNIFVGEARDIEILFVPVPQNVTSTHATVSNGTVTINREQLGIGDTVIITFNPDFGYRRSEWTINGQTIEEMRALGTNARVSRDRNQLTFTVSAEWIEKWQGALNYDITAELDPMVFVGIAAGSIAIIVLLIGLVFMIRANQRKKADYKVAQQKAKEAKARMGHADLISKLKEGG